VEDLLELRKELPVAGLNVTAPFKEDILRLCDWYSEEVKELQAANTLVFEREVVKAFNTDVAGVSRALNQRLQITNVDKIAILGAGGAARAACSALSRLSGRITVFNRSVQKGLDLAERVGGDFCSLDKLPKRISKYKVIINTLPNDISVLSKIKLNKTQFVLDANYKKNSLQSSCESFGAQYISGVHWLLFQAEEAFEHFMDAKPGWDQNGKASFKLPQQKLPDKKIIALIGPMGAGKTTLAKKLAEKLNYSWLDMDNEIEKMEGESISSIFSQKGEDYFRKMESDLLAASMEKEHLLLSTGGGIIMSAQNRQYLKKAHVIYLHAAPAVCAQRINAQNRPLLQGQNIFHTLAELLKQRLFYYIKTADVIVNAALAPTLLIDLIYEDFSKSFLD
jgi:shikimate dehydrogenase